VARAHLEVADILRRHAEAYRKRYRSGTSLPQWRVIRALQQCRTAALGGHIAQCDRCGHQVISYNSGRNRHCPKCQSLAKARWLEARRAELLPVPYYHVVFTLPDSLAPLALQNKRLVYDLLFQTAAQTLLAIAADPKHLGATIGFLAVLHTWGQTLLHHPHLHCVVPGGGLSPDRQRWVACRPGFFLPVRVLSRLFRRLFLEALDQAFKRGRLHFHGTLQPLSEPTAFARLLEHCRASEWVVYAKPPFGGPQKVLDYLSRYTHRIAIANHRLLTLHDGRVTFRWKDYQHGGRQRTMTLDAVEFIRRFLLHVLPDRFVRIRYFGLLANGHRTENTALCRELLAVAQAAGTSFLTKLDWPQMLHTLTGENPLSCPLCHRGHMIVVESLPPSPSFHNRAPPEQSAS